MGIQVELSQTSQKPPEAEVCLDQDHEESREEATGEILPAGATREMGLEGVRGVEEAGLLI